MSTLELLSFFFLFFLPHIAASKCHESKCKKSNDTPLVRFPFRLRNHNPSRCGYSTNFELSCNEQKQTILNLPSTSGDFIVKSIRYKNDQNIWINDQNKCLAKRFLDNDFSLAGSSFQFQHQLTNYTFFQCSPTAPLLLAYEPITCLSSENYKVIALDSSSWSSYFPAPSNCTAIATAMAPSNSYDWQYTDCVRLTWGVPDCRSCESSGGDCGLKKASNSQLHCSMPHSGLSNGMYPANFRSALNVGAPGLVFLITGLVFYIFTLIRVRLHPSQPLTELSPRANNGQHRVLVVTGLDESTIESYPNLQLGETWDFPRPEDNTCPICFCEYKPEETLRTTPECYHHFHAQSVEKFHGRDN